MFSKILSNINSRTIRSVLSQFVACLSTTFLFLDLGLAMNFSTIALPKLLNASKGLSLTDVQASWFGSIAYLTQPIGAIFSGAIVEVFGLRLALLLVSVPHLIAWPLMYSAHHLPTLFTANALMGIGTGVMEAPINSYIAEISEPSNRGALSTVMQLCVSIGMLIVYFLGLLVTWRDAALLCLAAPIASVVLVLFTPESPVRLLVKGKDEVALKNLKNLRGWTSEENVQTEFKELTEYSMNLKRCIICDSTASNTAECQHLQMNWIQRTVLKYRYVILCKETLRPLCFMILYFMFYVMSGLSAIKPNMVNICGAFGMAEDGSKIVANVGIITFLTGVLVIILIRYLGKRKLAITAMFFTFVFNAALSIYAKTQLDDTVFSYNADTFPKTTSYVPLVFFYLMSAMSGLSLHWILFAEVFPFRSRATAQGFTAAILYVINFIASKTLIDLESSVHLWGTFAVYTTFTFVGTIYLYFYLPETEGKSLQEIESFYNGGHRIFADDPFINFFKRFRRKSKFGFSK